MFPFHNSLFASLILQPQSFCSPIFFQLNIFANYLSTIVDFGLWVGFRLLFFSNCFRNLSSAVYFLSRFNKLLPWPCRTHSQPLISCGFFPIRRSMISVGLFVTLHTSYLLHMFSLWILSLVSIFPNHDLFHSCFLLLRLLTLWLDLDQLSIVEYVSFVDLILL